MLPFVIFFLLVGWGLAAFFIWVGCNKARAGRRLSFWVLAGCFFALGAFPLVGCLLNSEKWFAAGIALSIGVLLSFLSVESLIRCKWCTVPVEAYVKDLVPVYHRRGQPSRYVPVFSYRYLEKNYEERSFLNYTGRTLHRLFTVGERYEIFIDPRCPSCCADKRKLPYVGNPLLLLCALGFLAFGIVVICLPAASITVRT